MVGDVARMPILSTFFGITVRMYFAELGPPHVHVAYQGWEALVAIMDGRILQGGLPRRAQALVRQWCLDHPLETGAELDGGAGPEVARAHPRSRQ